MIVQQETKLANLERKVDHSRVLSKEFSSTAVHNNLNGDMQSAPPRAADGSQQEVLHRCTKLLASALNFPNLDFQLTHVINNSPNGNPTLHNSLHGNLSRSSPRVSQLSFPAVNGIHNPEQEQDQTFRHRQLKSEGQRQRELQYLEKEVRSCLCIRPMNCNRNYLLQWFTGIICYNDFVCSLCTLSIQKVKKSIDLICVLVCLTVGASVCAGSETVPGVWDEDKRRGWPRKWISASSCGVCEYHTHDIFTPLLLSRAQLNGHVCSPQKQESRKEEARNEIITPRLAKDIAPSQEEWG